MEIRTETGDDHGLVALLYRQAFVGNYEAELVEALREAGVAPISLVAMDGDELVGHILFTDVAVEVDGHPVAALALAEMAVHDEQRQAGIGSHMVRTGIAAARARDVAALLVLGHPTYYPRFGFSAERAAHLRTPFRGGEAFMALELVAGALDGGAGSVTYPEAFHITSLR